MTPSPAPGRDTSAECRRRFGDNLGFGRRHTAPAFITLALMLNGMGMPPLRVRIVLGHMNVDAHEDTISGWLAYRAGMVEWYANTIRPPNLGSELGADEKRQDIKGEEGHLVMAMDLATRFILAWGATADKTGHGATRPLEAAKAGRPYHILKTDGLSGYHAAFRRVFGSLRSLFIHIRGIHTRNAFPNIHKQERVNSTLAGHTKPARGTNSENPPACRIFVPDHNCIRPHGGMGGRTPAEAAGITMRGRDKRMAPFQNAAVAA